MAARCVVITKQHLAKSVISAQRLISESLRGFVFIKKVGFDWRNEIK